MTRPAIPIPPVARVLGFAGLLPFAATAMAGFFPAWPAPATPALIGYGAVILSFLGGIRWGMAMGAPDMGARLVVSVMPSLVGWLALLVPPAAGLILLATGFAAMLVVDLAVREAPSWYPRLRLPLSVGAIACLLLGLLG